MTTGGIFTLITNDGKQDRMLMASEFLKARLARIQTERKAKGLEPTPTLVDIEKTHVLFMNAHFKPYAAIGFEYNKVKASAGSPALDSEVQFSLPQFGDFFSDMVLHVRLPAVSATAANTWRWCAFPGEQLLSKVSFTVNGNPLDEYTSDDYAFYRKYELPVHQRDGYFRCVGQQLPRPARLVPDIGSTLTTAGVGGYGTGVATSVADSVGMWVNVTDGYQTTKTQTAHASTADGYVRTDVLEVTVPLLFWFNMDPRLAIPSVAIPYGQRFITVKFNALSYLAQGQVVSGAGGASSSDSTAATLTLSSSSLQTCTLYVNNIFVNPEIHDIFIKRIGFNLIRVHRRQVARIQEATTSELLLNNLKWPIEQIYFGLRPVAQSTPAATNVFLDGWHMFSKQYDKVAGLTFDSGSTAVLHAAFATHVPLLQQVGIRAHGIPIYSEIPAVMFNQYYPWAFGDKLNTCDDPGAYVILFNLYPKVYQPSGHINLSRAREFHIIFDDTTSSVNRQLGTAVDSSNPADLVVSATAINFLLIADGSAVLRYST